MLRNRQREQHKCQLGETRVLCSLSTFINTAFNSHFFLITHSKGTRKSTLYMESEK